MKHMKLTMAGCLVLFVTVLIGQEKTEQQRDHSPSSAEDAQAAEMEHGQWVFEHNCSRCHDAPLTISPRISGTIAKHMRVRANLSGADYKALLIFLKQ